MTAETAALVRTFEYLFTALGLVTLAFAKGWRPYSLVLLYLIVAGDYATRGLLALTLIAVDVEYRLLILQVITPFELLVIAGLLWFNVYRRVQSTDSEH